MIDPKALDLASISWGILVIIFLLMIIAGRVKLKGK